MKPLPKAQAKMIVFERLTKPDIGARKVKACFVRVAVAGATCSEGL
jgi:hypothetical protein